VNLPRQTYKTAADDAAEAEIARIFAARCNMAQLKIGDDPHDDMKSAIDRLVFSDAVVRGFFEAKTCTYRFEDPDLEAGWTIGVSKILAGRALHKIVRLPVVIVVRFSCATIAWIDVHRDYTLIPKWGRRDRNDPADIEDGARFQWRQFKILKQPGEGERQ
jgi:hypothetical protein